MLEHSEQSISTKLFNEEIRNFALNGDNKLIEMLRKKEISINQTFGDREGGPTLLHFASMHNRSAQLLKKLVKYEGANLFTKDKNDLTPLHYAIVNKNIEAVQILLEKIGADYRALASVIEDEQLAYLLEKESDIDFVQNVKQIIAGQKNDFLLKNSSDNKNGIAIVNRKNTSVYDKEKDRINKKIYTSFIEKEPLLSLSKHQNETILENFTSKSKNNGVSMTLGCDIPGIGKTESVKSLSRENTQNNYQGYNLKNDKNKFPFRKEAPREKLSDEETVKQKLANRIPNYFQLGAAIGQGDCFFDAMAQSLNALKGSKEYTAKSLRLLCDDYVKSGKYTWVKEAIAGDNDNYEHYLVRLPFTVEELEKEEKANTGLKLKDIVWGRPEIEGRMICDITKVKLHVIGVLEQPINGMDVTEQLVDAHALEPITTIEKGQYDSSDTIHLVNYHHHFVPLLDSKISQVNELSAHSNEKFQKFPNKENDLSMAAFHLEQALPTLQAYADNNQPLIANIMLLLGKTFLEQRNLEAALYNTEKALTIFEATGIENKNPQAYAEAMLQLSNIYLQKWNLDKALNYAEKALTIFEATGIEKNNLQIYAEAMLQLSNIYLQKWDSNKALRYADRALVLLGKADTKDKDPQTYAEVILQFSNIYLLKNNLDIALDYTNKALNIFKGSNIKASILNVVNFILLLSKALLLIYGNDKKAENEIRDATILASKHFGEKLYIFIKDQIMFSQFSEELKDKLIKIFDKIILQIKKEEQQKLPTTFLNLFENKAGIFRPNKNDPNTNTLFDTSEKNISVNRP